MDLRTCSKIAVARWQMTRRASKDEVLDAFRASSRIALIHTSDGLVAINTVKELMSDRGRPHDNLYVWAPA